MPILNRSTASHMRPSAHPPVLLTDPAGAERRPHLTGYGKPPRVRSVTDTTFMGLPADEIDAMAAQASEVALREAVAAGVAVTWLVEGKPVTLQPSDPRLAKYRDGRQDAQAA